VKTLVTGITGFAGSHLAEHLLQCGDRVLGCSRGGRWADDAPAAVRRIPLTAWDLTEPLSPAGRAQIAEFAPECIYHLAALSVPTDCGGVEPSSLARAVNVDGTAAVLRLAAELPEAPKVLLSSSCHVYRPVDPATPRIDEQAPVGPPHGYGKTKLAAEAEVARAVAAGGDAIVARCFQHTGPRQAPQMMLPQWAQQFARGDDPVRVLCRDAHLDLSDVRDIVRAYRLLIEHGAAGETYNVGSSVSRRSGALLALLQSLAERNPAVEELAPGHRQQPIADCTKLEAHTGWQGQIPIETTVADTLQYWQRRETTS